MKRHGFKENSILIETTFKPEKVTQWLDKIQETSDQENTSSGKVPVISRTLTGK